MTQDRRLEIVLVLNLVLVGALIVVGLAAHSLGVLAAGVDYAADAAAVGLALAALRLSRRPPTSRRPDGYTRATRQAALVNAGWLLTLNVVVAAEATRRLVHGAPQVLGAPVLVVSAIAALVMTAGAFVLGGDSDDLEDHGSTAEHERLNVRAVLLDTVADASAAGGVAVAGLVILLTHGTYWLDPAVALVIALVVGFHAVRLLTEITRSLREPGPSAR